MQPRPGRYVRRNGDSGKNITRVNTEAGKSKNPEWKNHHSGFFLTISEGFPLIRIEEKSTPKKIRFGSFRYAIPFRHRLRDNTHKGYHIILNSRFSIFNIRYLFGQKCLWYNNALFLSSRLPNRLFQLTPREHIVR
jgi:hypothetical protein